MANTTQLGDIAELMTAAELARRGYVVSRPLTNGAPYDLLVDTADGIKRVQIKKASPIGIGVFRIALCSNKWHRGRTRVSYFGKVDFLVAVDIERSIFYIFGGDDLNSDELRIRIEPTLNNQKSGVRLASDYLIDRMLPHLVESGMVGDEGFEPPT